ncbi:hypothetical protein GCM10009839_88810 [Catenulispora yoronensis]|uniref:Uncharacterized protein n=1 Tax=Catenulispora yoronensis TaxID=450799 RepID=A0ABN2VJE5_9ACTN
MEVPDRVAVGGTAGTVRILGGCVHAAAELGAVPEILERELFTSLLEESAAETASMMNTLASISVAGSSS